MYGQVCYVSPRPDYYVSTDCDGAFFATCASNPACGGSQLAAMQGGENCNGQGGGNNMKFTVWGNENGGGQSCPWQYQCC